MGTMAKLTKLTGKLKVTTPSDREIRMTRVFDAPRELLFEAWTTPQLVSRWLLGRPAGRCRSARSISMSAAATASCVRNSSSGTEMGWGGVYREIVAPERIVATELFDQDWTGGETQVTMLLTVEDGGKTRLTETMLFSSPEARNGALRTDIERAVAANYDRLEGLLALKLARKEGRSAA